MMGLEPVQPSSTVTISEMPAEMPTLENASVRGLKAIVATSIWFYWCQHPHSPSLAVACPNCM